MYKIIYQKKDGTIFERMRDTLPGSIGYTTSMGWTIKDILYSFKDEYYSYDEYKKLSKKRRRNETIKRNVILFFRKYKTSMLALLFLPFYLLK